MQGNEGLTAKQERFIALLVASDNIAAAARTCGINEATAHRWLHLPDVQAALSVTRKSVADEMLAEVKQTLRDAAPHAIEVLRKHMRAKVRPSSGTQLSSAKFLIDKVFEIDKLEALELRIQELEAMVRSADE
jgi:hypothetical protein